MQERKPLSPENGTRVSLVEQNQDEINLLSQSEELSYPFNEFKVVSAIRELIQDIGTDLNNYDGLISDDTSARLLTLLLHRVINIRRHDAGLPGISAYFVGTSTYHRSDPINLDQVPSLDKVLLVTEGIWSGETISRILKGLKRKVRKVDIATLSMYHKKSDYGDLKSYKLYTTKDPCLFMDQYFHVSDSPNGVKKPEDCTLSSIPRLDREIDRQAVIDSRHSITSFAHQLVKSLPPISH